MKAYLDHLDKYLKKWVIGESRRKIVLPVPVVVAEERLKNVYGHDSHK